MFVRALAAIAVLSFLGIVFPADAREWSSSPQALAQNYLFITHRQSDSRFSFIYWGASPIIAGNDTSSITAREVIDRYVILGTGTLTIDATGVMRRARVPQPKVTNGEGTELELLEPADLPPAMLGVVVTMQQVMASNLGDVGDAIDWHVYEANGTTACTPGDLLVTYGGTTYDYRTPIPGCHDRA